MAAGHLTFRLAGRRHAAGWRPRGRAALDQPLRWAGELAGRSHRCRGGHQRQRLRDPDTLLATPTITQRWPTRARARSSGPAATPTQEIMKTKPTPVAVDSG